MGGAIDAQKLTDRLNELGIQGWDLVSIFDTNMLQGQTRDVIAVLKRPASRGVRRILAHSVNRHGTNPNPACPLFSEFVPDFAALEQVVLPSAHTVLFIAADASGIHTHTIARIAERLLASGLVYVCIWGPDCERVHDIFDEVHIGDGETEPSVTLMSTWHTDESLEAAISFFIQCAFPPGTEIETTSYLAIAVGDSEWAAIVERALSDLPSFTTRMLADDLRVCLKRKHC